MVNFNGLRLKFQFHVLSQNMDLGRDTHNVHSQANKTNPSIVQAHTGLSSKSGLPGEVSYLSEQQCLPVLTGRNICLTLRTIVSFK